MLSFYRHIAPLERKTKDLLDSRGGSALTKNGGLSATSNLGYIYVAPLGFWGAGIGYCYTHCAPLERGD